MQTLGIVLLIFAVIVLPPLFDSLFKGIGDTKDEEK
jgi:hypothetical protein